MFTPSFTISQDGQALKTFPDTEKERAVSVAKAFAATTEKDVIITAHLDAETDRDVVFHPDGTNEKIWIIDMGKRMEPVVGQVYINRGGGRFRCIAPAAAHVLQCGRRLQQRLRRVPEHQERLDVHRQGRHPVHRRDNRVGPQRRRQI